jgi:hypothetical protein
MYGRMGKSTIFSFPKISGCRRVFKIPIRSLLKESKLGNTRALYKNLEMDILFQY